MRKVEFKEWVLVPETTTSRAYGTWSDTYTGTGLFHQWANAYEEFESGPGNYTVALIEVVQSGGILWKQFCMLLKQVLVYQIIRGIWICN